MDQLVGFLARAVMWRGVGRVLGRMKPLPVLALSAVAAVAFLATR